MLKCKNCKAEIPEGSPEIKICPYCGQPELKFVEVKVEKKKEPSKKVG